MGSKAGTKKIALIDPDPDTITDIKKSLSETSFQITEIPPHTPDLLQSIADIPQLDILIFEINLGQTDGISLVHQIRRKVDLMRLKLIVLTDRNEEFTEVAAFEEGVDDYVIKPVKPHAFRKRVLRIADSTRRDYMSGVPTDAFVFIHHENTIIFKGKEIKLPRKSFQLLEFLSSNSGILFSREELMSIVWEDKLDETSRTVDVHIRKIRERIGNEYITTLKGIGYIFNPNTES